MGLCWKSFKMGLGLGLSGKPLPLNTKREPVAYLYNGVRLPKLPEWDKETYPYACIQQSWTDRYDFYISSKPLYVAQYDDISNRGRYFLENLKGTTYWQCRSGAEMVKWESGVLVPFPYETLIVYDPEMPTRYALTWTNHDILKSDGSVYLAASDPIPVYE
jgi:hypothetical protein